MVAINLVMNGVKALKNLGVDLKLLEAFKAEGGEVKLTSKRFIFNIGAAQQQMDMSLDDSQMLSAGKLSPAKKASLCAQAEYQMHSLLESMQSPLMEVFMGDKNPTKAEKVSIPAPKSILSVKSTSLAEMLVEGFKDKALNKLPPLVPAAEEGAIEKPVKKSSTVAGSWAPMSLTEAKKASKVPLIDADRMYQPVKGTSAGSRYYVIGGGAGLAVAARISGNSLSVRIEGAYFDEHKKRIAAVGLGVHSNYASVHLDCKGDETLFQKTMGSILSGLGLPLETPIPLLSNIPKE